MQINGGPLVGKEKEAMNALRGIHSVYTNPWLPEATGEQEERERVEILLLLEGLFRLYGYDFRNYAYPSLRRRIWHRVYAERLSTISGLQERVIHDRSCMERLLGDLVIHVTEMFRDPTFFAAFREQVILKEKMVFAQHNLVTDRSFNEFHVIFCRNVLIYFDSHLQNQVHRLIYDSLSASGILVLGHKESMAFSTHADDYEALEPQEKIFRKVK